MPGSARRRELGRGERVLPGVWRLRLPLPWPGVPHCNAWALAAGDGVVLVDSGLHEQGSLHQLELAMSQVGLKLEDVRLLGLGGVRQGASNAPSSRPSAGRIGLHEHHELPRP